MKAAILAAILRHRPAPEPEFDTDAAAYFAALVTPLSLPTRIAINSHVLALKSSGVWAALDWYLLLANETEEAAYRNLRNPTKTASAVNAPPWTQWLGSSGNAGASAHVACSDEFIFAGSNFTLNAAHVGFMCNRNDTNANSATIGPAGNNFVHYSLVAPGGNEAGNLNNNVFATTRVATITAGDRVGTRGGTDARRWSYNGVVNADPGAVGTAPAGLACVHRRGTLYGSRRIAVFHYGGPLTHAQIGALYTAKYAYLEAIGGLGDAYVAPPEPPLAGLVGSGDALTWEQPGLYGLSDGVTYPLEWSDTPAYKVRVSDMIWQNT